MNESTAQGVASQSVAPARAGAARLMSDSRLTRRAADGDQRAFAAIFHRYHQDLYRYCVAILGDPQDAQDALQNTMVKVLAALPGEQREIRLKPWLYRIAHNEAIDLRRGQRPTETLDAEIPLVEAGPAQAIETRDRVRRLVGDIGMLPERQRGALVMRELGDLSFEQIGAAFGTSAAVARQTVYEARLSLQQMSEGREMDCAAVTKALSDGDGRLLRRRDMRAHLRNCRECRRFEDGLKDRQRDLAAIAPLPAVVATGLLQGLIGGGAGAGSAVGAGSAAGGGALAGAGAATGKTVAGSVLAKSAATVAVVAVVGVSAADRSGLVDVGLPDRSSGTTEQTAPAGSSQPPAEQGGSVPTEDAGTQNAGTEKQSQLKAGKALGKPSKQSGKDDPGSQAAGHQGGPSHPTPNGKGEGKGRSEAHHEGRHGNGSPVPTPNKGQGNPNHGQGSPNKGQGNPHHGQGSPNHGQSKSANQGHRAADKGRQNAGRSHGAGSSHRASHDAATHSSPPKASPPKGSERKSGTTRASGKKGAGRGKAAAPPHETLP
jgi:RNA polymerase sigma factor (sigma-70 family)